jgi:hypothetical protein
MLLPAHTNVKISSDEQHAIFLQELQSSVKLMVGFLDVNCEVYKICNLNIKLILTK